MVAAAVLFPSDTKMPRFQAQHPDRKVTQIFSLLEPKHIPPSVVPYIVEHLKKLALSYAVVQRPAVRVVNSEDTPWAVMGQAAARTAERAAHLSRQDVQVGREQLEIHIPAGGALPYEFVGKIGQRPVVTDWRRSAAHLMARHVHRTHMLALSEQYPDHGFDQHLGRDSPEHRRAIKQYGATPEHRGSLT